MEKLTFPSASAPAGSLQHEAYGFYYSLTRTADVVFASHPQAEPNLGGNFLYAGELDASGSARVIAGSVAGCATLVATADLSTQRQASRDGAVDFMVTSLDEALRILKNEIRKRATVSVCVGLPPSNIERQMLERGVLPDLVFAEPPDKQRSAPRFGAGSHEIQLIQPDPNLAFLEWRIAAAPMRWMAKLDAIARESLRSDPWAHRWIRLSPRYSGRIAQGQRALYCDSKSAAQIINGFRTAVQGGSLETEVSASLSFGGETKAFLFTPSGNA